MPRLDQPRKAKLDPIVGQPPDLARLDEGCAFRPRCSYAVERCAAEVPPLEVAVGEHLSACWRKDELERPLREVS